MKRFLIFLASAIIGATALAQITQPPGGITGNTGGWAGGNGTSGQILTSRGVNLAPTFQALPAGGTVTSVGLTVPSWETVSGSPVTTSGTLAVTAASGQTANSFLATPNGSTGAVALRTIAAADVPALGANPTALVGPTATNGVATTYMRSDGAPAIDLTANYTWTGTHTVSSAEPRWLFRETDQGSDQKLWDIDLNSLIFCIRTRTDADAAGVNAICATRGTGTAITAYNFGDATNNPAYNFLGTGTLSVSTITTSQTVNAARVSVSNSTAPAIGIYSGGGSRLSFSVGTTLRGEFTTGGLFANNFGILSQGTKFTASGCSNSTTVGGSTAGTYASGTTGTCTVVITLPASANGWRCTANDMTTPADVQNQTASTTTSCTVSGTTVTGDVIIFSAMGF